MVVLPARSLDLRDLGVGGGAGIGGRGLRGGFLRGPDLLGALAGLFLKCYFLASGVVAHGYS